MTVDLESLYGMPSLVFTENTPLDQIPTPGEPTPVETTSKPPGDYKADVQWVFDNFSRMVVIEPRKDPVILYDKLKAEAPSSGAEGLMIWAAYHQGNFYQQVCPRVLTRKEQEDAVGPKWNRERDEDLEKLAESIKHATGGGE